jgi:hypothetical protein
MALPGSLGRAPPAVRSHNERPPACTHGIGAKDVNQLVWGYVDDMLSDLFYGKEGELTGEIEEDIEREGQRP